MLHLPPERTARVSHNADGEATLAIGHADDPLLETWSFLLIVRTGRFVTVHPVKIRPECDEYRRMLGVPSIRPAPLTASLLRGATP